MAKKKKTKKRASKKVDDGLAAFAAKAEKQWPNTTTIADKIERKYIPLISTGNVGLDIAMHGGWPRGRVGRAFGREKSAKTGSCLNTVASWQKHCGVCYERGPCAHGTVSGEDRPKAAALWVDAENRLESMWYWVEGHGVDLSRLLVQVPPTGQHIIDFVDATIREKGAGIGLIVVDSIAHITSEEEIKKPTMKGRTAPVNALLLNKGIRKWTSGVNSLGVTDTKKPTVILINQIRFKIDGFGNPEVMPGGKGQDFATSIDVRFSSGKYHYIVEADGGLEDKSIQFGSRWKPEPDSTPDYVEINYRVTASGVCPNGRYGQFNYWLKPVHGRRIGDPDNVDRLWEYARRCDLMQKEGRVYRLGSLEAATQAAMRDQFFGSYDAQYEVWLALVSKLCKKPTAETSTEQDDS